MGNLIGSIKTAARRVGCSINEYRRSLLSGKKWCTACKNWHPRSDFTNDRSRSDGLRASCRASYATGNPRGWHGKQPINPKTGRPGPSPKTAVDGDRIQARQRINVEVQRGRRANPNVLPCTDCGHIGHGRRHEYDHYLGYQAEHHADVQPVCTTCHAAREKARGVNANRRRNELGQFQ